MKKIKIFTALVVMCMMVAINVEKTSATASRPYGSYDTAIASGGGSAGSYISKCSCNPVNNYLMAAIQVQYKSGGNYYWTPGSGSYYYSEGTNVEGKMKTISQSNITYAKGWFKARCGSGSVKEYYDTATR